jgi:hypothetical protein
MASILLTLLAFSALALAQLPRLPNTFSVDIEANLLDQNKTLNVREYIDFNLGLTRYEQNSLDSYTYIITNLNTKEVYTIVNDLTCTQTPYVPDTVLTARSTEDLLFFGDKYNPTYVGKAIVREIPCDSWISYISFVANGTTLANGTIVGAGWFHNFSIQYFFSDPVWGFRAANATQKPMRATLIGSRTSPDGSMVYYFNHNYEFVNFIPKAPLESIFNLPPACVGYPAQVYKLISTPAGGGLAAGMFFLGLFIGSGICGLSIWVYCRRRQLARDKFASSLANQAAPE